jgi:hypothetical protein
MGNNNYYLGYDGDILKWNTGKHQEKYAIVPNQHLLTVEYDKSYSAK